MQYCNSGKRRAAKSVVKPDHILTLPDFQLAGSCSDLACTEYISCPSAGHICYWEQANNLEAAGVPFGDGFARDPCAMGSWLLNRHVPQWLGDQIRDYSGRSIDSLPVAVLVLPGYSLASQSLFAG